MEVTKASVWRAGELITLPSGKVAMLRRPSIMDLAAEQVDPPDLLTTMLIESLKNGQEGKDNTINIGQLMASDFPGLVLMMNRICKVCFMTPTVVDHADPNDETQIEVSWVELNDKLAILGWVMGAEFSKGATFPEKPGTNIPPVS